MSHTDTRGSQKDTKVGAQFGQVWALTRAKKIRLRLPVHAHKMKIPENTTLLRNLVGAVGRPNMRQIVSIKKGIAVSL